MTVGRNGGKKCGIDGIDLFVSYSFQSFFHEILSPVNPHTERYILYTHFSFFNTNPLYQKIANITSKNKKSILLKYPSMVLYYHVNNGEIGEKSETFRLIKL